MTDILSTENLSISFGGVAASRDINFSVAPGEIHAIIGPNGAGKTTLVNLLSGELRPTAGRIVFDGADITRLSPAPRSKAGLARTYQITSVLWDFTARENVSLAIQAHNGHSFSFFRNVAKETALVEGAQKYLEQVGLAEQADVLASELAHGQQRRLEIAMGLATGPKLLLLDEPLAGMGIKESWEMVELLKALRGAFTIVLIEHDMEAVFALADRITVLVYGQIIATGTVDEIRGHPEVAKAYLGEAAA